MIYTLFQWRKKIIIKEEQIKEHRLQPYLYTQSLVHIHFNSNQRACLKVHEITNEWLPNEKYNHHYGRHIHSKTAPS